MGEQETGGAATGGVGTGRTQTGRWSREELEQAHDHYRAVAAEAAASGNWRPWADLFTDDAEYCEHHFGTYNGREEIYQWISTTMAEWPNSAMKSFPHTWCVCDEERGWWVCRIENRFEDPGDGEIYQEHNITLLKYAGDGKFSYEEDAYNPANFAETVKAWIDAKRAHRSAAEGVDQSGPARGAESGQS